MCSQIPVVFVLSCISGIIYYTFVSQLTHQIKLEKLNSDEVEDESNVCSLQETPGLALMIRQFSSSK